ncbi:hypothetical protein QTA58_05065 [Neorhizobium sp. CSC1952]|uniref:hypothetical protein n=1 Tax=Neorhizobium sp. CSC1952 TaxID=2978974 RepID=UPI0025A68AEF|nr:hypothetical protein [Rhizobium sp. CSC1952]WJR68131.1 hypothetical protein QTA58_05065 [Rhizobium sp. CSC1952]
MEYSDFYNATKDAFIDAMALSAGHFVVMKNLASSGPNISRPFARTGMSQNIASG